MESTARRKRIEQVIAMSDGPVTGAQLAALLEVTRQVVVQDIALLRAGGAPIVATPSGYLHIEPGRAARPMRVFTCRHETLEEAEKELMIMVENGGKVLDVIIEHPIYGEISGSLMLNTPQGVKNLIGRLRNKDSQMLSSVTDGVHMHTVEAGREESLAEIEKKLAGAGILL